MITVIIFRYTFKKCQSSTSSVIGKAIRLAILPSLLFFRAGSFFDFFCLLPVPPLHRPTALGKLHEMFHINQQIGRLSEGFSMEWDLSDYLSYFKLKLMNWIIHSMKQARRDENHPQNRSNRRHRRRGDEMRTSLWRKINKIKRFSSMTMIKSDEWH